MLSCVPVSAPTLARMPRTADVVAILVLRARRVPMGSVCLSIVLKVALVVVVSASSLSPMPGIVASAAMCALVVGFVRVDFARKIVYGV